GLDIEPGFLAMARERNPGLTFHEGDMSRFDLGRAYDVITCLFSSIGYVKTPDALKATISCIAAHLRPGGIAVIEPWFRPDQWQAGSLHVLTVDEPELKLCRMNKSDVDADANLSVLDFHYLVGTAEGVRHFTEHHELGMFTIDQFAAAGAAAGLEHRHLDTWGRGLHLYSQTV
ncbi:MAG: class I SAM-dependent methyltransferase, partial [Planctomycetota bacterium]